MAGGRPPMYSSVEEMQVVIDDYFATHDHPDTGDGIYTVTGLALHLGFTSRQALLNYQEKPEFVDAIKIAKSRVEEFCEKMLYMKSPAGAIFALKNHGWTDKQEVAHSGNMQFTGINVTPPSNEDV